MITDLWFYMLAVPALLMASISKGGFGAGLGILSVTLLALRLPVPQITPILLPIVCLMDVASLWGYRGRWDGRVLAVTLPGALCGVLLGTMAVGTLSEAWLRLAVGATAMAFALQRWFASRLRPALAAPGGYRPAAGIFWSTVSGFTSFLANAGGPPFSIYMIRLGLDKTLFVGTSAVFFAVLNFSKLVPFAALGLFTRSGLLTALALSPIVLVGFRLGLWLHQRVDPRQFYRVSYLLLFLLGTKFVYDSLAVIVGAG